MVTLKEIAKMCGVSVSTVSNILNGKPNVGEDTRQRVLEMIKETGYQPNYFAASMRKQNSKLISIIVEDLCQFTTPPIVEAIIASCEEMGYRTILMNLRLYDRWQDTWYHDEDKLERVLDPVLQEIESIKVDGNIYVAGHGRIIRCFPEDFKIPTVIAYATSENKRFPSILIDDEEGGYEMGKYLVAMGHKNIGVITGVADNMHSQKRLQGFQRALYESGIPYNPDWTFHGNWKKESGYACTEDVLKTGVSVIWCMNDQMAGGVYDYLYEHNIEVGKDISVAGFDNMSESEYMHPHLTTSELPLVEIGHKAAEEIIGLIENPENAQEFLVRQVPCKMILRDSVKKMKRGAFYGA